MDWSFSLLAGPDEWVFDRLGVFIAWLTPDEAIVASMLAGTLVSSRTD